MRSGGRIVDKIEILNPLTGRKTYAVRVCTKPSSPIVGIQGEFIWVEMPEREWQQIDLVREPTIEWGFDVKVQATR